MQTLTLRDRRYPALLKTIPDHPKKLYVRGDLDLLSAPAILAVVGARKASSYALQATETLLLPVIQAGCVIVSGLAFGVDSMAHRLCVELGRPTIAVLGSGVNDGALYPKAHLSLAHRILEHGGAVISEYSPGTPGRPHRFPERNRIIAGLARATLLIQAAQRSGSLITARLALDYGRDVAAVPGPITDPLSQGTNRLIQNGAAPILESQDLFDLMGLEKTKAAQETFTRSSPEQRAILTLISQKPVHVDVLIARLRTPAPAVMAELTQLELAGIIKHLGGMNYARK